MKHYKVVTHDLKSVQNFGNVAGVQYIKDDWAHAHDWLQARGYGLMVFNSRKAVTDFFKHTSARLFECHVRKIKHKLPMRGLSCYWTDSYLPITDKATWVTALIARGILTSWPKGTVMVKSVKLTREVCPQCGSWEGLKWPRKYCEDCGWPDEDFDNVK